MSILNLKSERKDNLKLKNNKRLRMISFILCMTVIMSVLSVFGAVFAHETENAYDNRRTLTPREGENTTPDTDGNTPETPGDTDMGDNDVIPAPDTDPDSGVIEGDPDKDDGRPDDDANIGDNDEKDNNDDKENADDKDEKDEKKFSYTGLIVALIIAVAVIILLAVMIPMNKKKDQGR